MKLLKSLLKLGLGGGAVYVAADQGLFSASQKGTIESMKNMTKSIPGLDSYLEKIPSISSMDVVHTWNHGVTVTIRALASLPTDTADLAASGVDYIKEELKKQQAQIPDKK